MPQNARVNALQAQPAILTSVPPRARFVLLGLRDGVDPRPTLVGLAARPHDPKAVVGLGAPLVDRLGANVSGLRAFPGDMAIFPATQHAIWLALTHADAGDVFDAGRAHRSILGNAFDVVEEIDAFVYRGGKDLSGFEDGTENPKGDAAVRAAISNGHGAGIDGASFVAVQRWVHDLGAAERMSIEARENAVGRRLESNEEMADAPLSAHVKRTAQESFEPEAFVLRRSMPYGGLATHGLYFVAYGESLDRFERQLRRMGGRDDGVVDGLFTFTRAVTGGYYFCPPLRSGKLDLRALGL
ncbi:MAG TPA: Dyp-type peroxidase [Polyangiaceae bacterium]|nr:Dyp-type peroxidase [Polyangiaceae bacterium]